MACLVLRSATAGPDSSTLITAATPASRSSCGCTALTSPYSRASAAVMRSASSAIRMARIRPIAAATSADAPPSGIRPILVKASRKNALSDATTTSQANANETPTPAAGPPTTATTGLGNAAMARTARLASASNGSTVIDTVAAAWSSALIPAPELNPRPAPPSRTTLTSGSVAARSRVSATVLSMASVNEFRLSGRLKVNDSTPPSKPTVRSPIPV